MPIGLHMLHRSVVLCTAYMHTYTHTYIYILCTLRCIYIYMCVCMYICMKFFHLPEIVRVSWHKGRALHDHFATLGSARAGVGIFCGSWLCRCLGTQWCASLPMAPMGVMGKSWSSWTIDLCGYGSIPINTIFRGMNIHKSQLFWCSLGTRVLTHPHVILGAEHFLVMFEKCPGPRLVHVIGKFPSLGFKPWVPEWKQAKWLDPPLSGWSNPTDMNFD